MILAWQFVDVQAKLHLTPEEYLAIERQAETRSEFVDGLMVAKPGGSLRHGLIVANLVAELSSQLKGLPGIVCACDLRVHVPATGLYTYPDIVVVCGEPRLEDQFFDTLLNPTLLVEVLSPTTEAYDRGKKFEHYRTIETLAEYLLIAQDEPRVEQYLRQEGNRWLLTAMAGLEGSLALPSIQCELALAEIYDKVSFG